jgi:hypothetical protein
MNDCLGTYECWICQSTNCMRSSHQTRLDCQTHSSSRFLIKNEQESLRVAHLFHTDSASIKSSGAGNKVFELLDRKPPAPSTNILNVGANNKGTIGNQCGTGFVSNNQSTIRQETIFLSRPSRPNVIILENMNLTTPKGKRLLSSPHIIGVKYIWMW